MKKTESIKAKEVFSFIGASETNLSFTHWLSNSLEHEFNRIIPSAKSNHYLLRSLMMIFQQYTEKHTDILSKFVSSPDKESEGGLVLRPDLLDQVKTIDDIKVLLGFLIEGLNNNLGMMYLITTSLLLESAQSSNINEHFGSAFCNKLQELAKEQKKFAQKILKETNSAEEKKSQFTFQL